jgi:two-component sensor histidine kinase
VKALIQLQTTKSEDISKAFDDLRQKITAILAITACLITAET